ncbi:trypsin-like serine protease [Endozoicomonas sp. 8E]|uniref:trypsin-like serine protease n=1 Tax=Endozoicomonas sp. 8E TaxID=3035692 RepID=UPI0029391888|nr:trypsin-like serine protease [Endozoicomonas sp. 8E]WOG30254.1 trypsin-like serine protease [Endozoicomonas sp. 8E]
MHYFGLVFLIVYSGCIFALDRQKRYTEPTEVVAPGLLPWVVKMTDASGTFTGVLISDRHIVTVAHALDTFSDTDCLKAHFKNALAPFSVRASRYILHSKFDSSRIIYNYDFAIIELDQKISLDEKGIKLPLIDNKTYLTNDLYKINPIYAVAYSDHDALEKVILTWLSVKNSVYELNYAGYGEDGNSGGPLFYSMNDTAYLLGLLDASSGVAGGVIIFEALSKYLDFIEDNTSLKKSQKDNWKDVICIFDITVGIGAGVVGTLLGITAILCVSKKLKETRLTGEAI